MRRTVHALTVLAVALVGVLPALAAPPTLVIPSNLSPVNGYYKFTPEGTAKTVGYIAHDDAYPFPAEDLKDPRRFLLPLAGLKPGTTYRFTAVGTLNDELTFAPFALTTPGVTPPPIVKPNDQKADPPAPTPGKVKSVRVAVVTESGDKNPKKAEFLMDPALQAYWKERGWDGVWWIDPNVTDPQTKATPEKWKAYVAQAKALAIPAAVFLIDRDTGDVLYQGAFPATSTPAEFLKLVKEKTGG